MAVPHTPGQISQLAKKGHRFAIAWTVIRTDTITFRVVNHDLPLVDVDGNLYVPNQSFMSSARHKSVAMEPQNIDYSGWLDVGDAAFNNADLLAGKYRDAEVQYRILDTRYPWIGNLDFARYFIVDTRFDGEQWQVTVEGLHRNLTNKVGDIYGRTCRHQLGDALCAVDLGPLTQTGRTVSVVNTQRLVFESDATGVDNFYEHGKLTWVTGLNTGFEVLPRKFESVDGKFTLHIATVKDITVGDTFDIEPGCDKILNTCNVRFTNGPHFGGYPFMPGADKSLRSKKTPNG